MASTVFIDRDPTTPIVAAWLNDLNRLNYDIFDNAATKAAARTALGLGPSGDPVFNTVTVSSLTVGRIVVVGTAGLLVDDSGLTFNTGTNVLTATGGFVGALTGNVVGNVTGNVTGNINGTVGAITPTTSAFTTISASGQITSTVSTGTAPLVIASTTVIANLNSSLLLGNTWAIPGTIGSTTPNSGVFTTLSSTGTTVLGDAAGDSLTVTAGTLSMPNIPCVMAYLSVTQANKTGNNTAYQVIFDTEIKDQGNNYNNTTGFFTAPTTGSYLVTTTTSFGSTIAGATEVVLTIQSSNRNWTLFDDAWSVTTTLGFTAPNGSAIIDMDAGDTCDIIARVNGVGADTTDIIGTAGPLTFLTIVQVA